MFSLFSIVLSSAICAVGIVQRQKLPPPWVAFYALLLCWWASGVGNHSTGVRMYVISAGLPIIAASVTFSQEIHSTVRILLTLIHVALVTEHVFVDGRYVDAVVMATGATVACVVNVYRYFFATESSK